VTHRITALHHVQLAMPAGREEEAEAFYSGVLGFERVAKPPELEKRGGCWFRSGSIEVHLGVEADFRPARKAHPALQIDGLAELRARLVDAGAEVWEDSPLEGYDRFYASDPFGNRLEFLQARA
jgi:catechol 2,3-dioxygenase-like lactoylglutathione lyase family enzyme